MNKNSFIRRNIFFFFTLLTILQSLATGSFAQSTYYIDGTDGNDGNDGLTPGTAWKTLSMIDNNYGIPAGTIIAIRDSIRYEGGLYFPSSGSSGNRTVVTNYYGSSSGRKPVIKSSNTVSTFTNVSGNVWSASYIPSTGSVNQVWFETDVDDPTLTYWGIAETSQANLNADLEWYWVSNVLYVYSATDPDTRFDYVEADCQSAWDKVYAIFASGDYVTIENLDVKYALGGGIRLGNSGSTNMIVQDCNASFTGTRSSESAHGIFNYNGNTNIIRRNRSFENSNHGIYVFANDGAGSTYGVLVDSNIVYNNKHSQIDVNTNEGTLDSIVCKRNTLYIDQSWWAVAAGYYSDGFFISGQFEGGSTSRVYLISNLMINVTGAAMDIDAYNVNSIYIYGNTIYNDITSNKHCVYMINSTYVSNFRNNIIYSVGTTGLLRVGSLTNKTLDNNLYYWNGSVTEPFFISSAYTTLAAWRTATGQETNSINDDPDFTTVGSDFNLLITSPAIDAGATLGSPFNVDILGVARPVPPDIGAYEYSDGSIIDLTPPQLISAQSVDSITVLLGFSEPMDEISVENPVNYLISNGINVFNALMTGTQVTLSTSAHTNGSYQVVVNNVTDLAGNLISTEYNSQTYEYQINGGSDMIQLPINLAFASVTPEPEHLPEKTIDGVSYGDGDPDSRWAGDTMPEWIMFDLGSVRQVSLAKLSFYNWENGRIYNYSVDISTDSTNWERVLSNVYSSSSEWTDNELGGIDARYIKILYHFSNQSGDWAGLWECKVWGYGDPLAVELTEFTGTANGSDVTLQWKTLSETNNAVFEIERKTTAGFEPISMVEGRGTTTEASYYKFVDLDLNADTYFYRLKMVEYDGTPEYSDVIKIDVTMPDKIILDQNFPNPFNPSTMIRFSIPQREEVKLIVYNLLGEIVTKLIDEELDAGSHSVEFGANDLSSGVYLYALEVGNSREIKKMIVMK